jgi:putative transposase
VFLVLERRRRRVLHFGVTEHPTAEWLGQQMVEAFSEQDAPRYLRDRDGSYGSEFRRRIRGLGMKEVITAPRSPWQSAFPERLIGSIRRECLDHVVVLNQRRLRKLMKEYFVYYHRSRTHLALPQDGYHPLLVQDSNGKLLDGGKKYAITFTKGRVPPLERSGP